MEFILAILIKLGVMYMLFVWGDFGLQSAYVAGEKAKRGNYEMLFYHAVTSNAPILLLWAIPAMNIGVIPGFSIPIDFNLTVLAIVIRIVSHGVIDALKAQFEILKTIKIDQFCHVSVDLALILTGLI